MKVSDGFKLCLSVLSLVLVVELALVYFIHRYEQMPVWVRTPPSEQARRNPYLAAMRLTEKLGLRAKALKSLHTAALPASGTLIIPMSREFLGRARATELLEWAKEGGHLVVVPTMIDWDDSLGEDDAPPVFQRRDAKLRDPLLDELWVGAKPIDAGETRANLPEGDEDVPTVDVVLSKNRTLSRVTPMSVELTYANEMPTWRLTAEERLLGLRLLIGAGAVTVLGDAAFMQNHRLAIADNAVLFWEIVRHHPSAEVWFVTSLDPPRLGEIIWQRGFAVVVSLLILIALLVWHHAVRFGPQTPDPLPIRRSLKEHVRATGDFLWRHHARVALVQACQHAVSNRARWRTPGWQRLAPDEQFQRIAKLTGVDVATVTAVLAQPNTHDPQAFLAAIQQLEHIRRHL